jgi:glycosyltransferase involved in cell wall biosynthesis
MPGTHKNLYTMFETSDVHPDIIDAMKIFEKVFVPLKYLRDILIRHEINAISLDFYTSDLIREKHAVIPKTLDPKRIVFLYIGTNDERKNVSTLSRAFSHLNHLLIIKTNHSNGLVQSPNIKIITKRLTNTQLAALYNMCDYVISATRGEGVGLPMLEGNYFKKPIIAHDQGVFRDVKQMISVPWIVIPSEEIPIDFTNVPLFLHKVFYGTWWNVKEHDIRKVLDDIIRESNELGVFTN